MSNKEKSKAITLIIISSMMFLCSIVAKYLLVSFDIVNQSYLYNQILLSFIFIVFSISNSFLLNNPYYTHDRLYSGTKYRFDKPDDMSKIKHDHIDKFLEYQRIIDEYNELTNKDYYNITNEGLLMIVVLFFEINNLCFFESHYNLYEILLINITLITIQVLIFNIFKFTKGYIQSQADEDFNNGFEKYNIKQCQNYGTYNSEETTDIQKESFFIKLSNINSYLRRLKNHKKYVQKFCMIICVIMLLLIMILFIFAMR